MLLARQGLAVELFERGQFPREKPCGEGLMPGGVAVLHRLGLAEAAGGAPFYGVRYHFGNHTAEGRFPSTPGFPIAGRGQRRRHLDQVLFNAAAATPGVTAHSRAHVDGPLIENGRVAGLVVEGEPRRAALVVAADGVHSRLRRLLGLDTPCQRRRLGARAHFRLAFPQEQTQWVDVFVGAGYEVYVAPLPEREVLVAALADANALREPVELAFRRWWQAQPALAARLEGAEQVSSLRCSFPLAGRARAGVAPGVVLLGDAAGFVDPITGGGMTQALMTAELLAKCVLQGLGQADRWLPDFDRKRDLLLRDYRWLTQTVLRLADHALLAQWLLSVLRVAPGILSHLIAVSAGMRPLFGSQRKWRRMLEHLSPV